MQGNRTKIVLARKETGRMRQGVTSYIVDLLFLRQVKSFNFHKCDKRFQEKTLHTFPMPMGIFPHKHGEYAPQVWGKTPTVVGKSHYYRTQMTQIEQMDTDYLLIFNLFICANLPDLCHLRTIV